MTTLNLLDLSVLVPLNNVLSVKSAAILRSVSKMTKKYIISKDYNKIFYYFSLWKENTKKIIYYRDYDDWCEINNNECFHCKYSECDRHF